MLWCLLINSQSATFYTTISVLVGFCLATAVFVPLRSWSKSVSCVHIESIHLDRLILSDDSVSCVMRSSVCVYDDVCCCISNSSLRLNFHWIHPATIRLVHCCTTETHHAYITRKTSKRKTIAHSRSSSCCIRTTTSFDEDFLPFGR